jgi:hypothetical protein
VTEASTNAIVLVTVNGAREREISVKWVKIFIQILKANFLFLSYIVK